MKPETQEQKIEAWLRAHPDRWITPMQALKMFGCFRLGARIFDIRKRLGQDVIERKMIKTADGARVAAYRWAQPRQEELEL